jgi:hypothetical protein
MESKDSELHVEMLLMIEKLSKNFRECKAMEKFSVAEA